jgi:hypothetical protein
VCGVQLTRLNTTSSPFALTYIALVVCSINTMAPLDPAVVHKSNVAPLATFAGQALLIAGLTAHILYTIRRAATTLPAASSTRAQQQSRRRNVAIFSTLAALSILSVTTFSIAWRVLSYFEWAERSNHNAPGAFWNGWFGTGQAGVDRWALGDWWSDVDLTLEWDKAALESPEHFLYTCQHFVGLAAAAMFYGVEGKQLCDSQLDVRQRLTCHRSQA